MIRVGRSLLVTLPRRLAAWLSAIAEEWRRDFDDFRQDRFGWPSDRAIDADLPQCDDCGRSIIRCRCGGGE